MMAKGTAAQTGMVWTKAAGVQRNLMEEEALFCPTVSIRPTRIGCSQLTIETLFATRCIPPIDVRESGCADRKDRD